MNRVPYKIDKAPKPAPTDHSYSYYMDLPDLRPLTDVEDEDPLDLMYAYYWASPPRAPRS